MRLFPPASPVLPSCLAIPCLFLALSLASCGSKDADPDADRVNAALTQLDGLSAQAMARTGIPGLAIAVVYRDQVVYMKGFGVRQVGRPDPVDADTVFQLASVSKPIASTVVAAVVGDGLVAWDDAVTRLDPGFALKDAQASRQLTLRDLFSHRSGLPDHAGDLLEDLGFSREEILRRLRLLSPEYPFRQGYAYTNFGLTEAAIAAARRTGMSWEDLSEKRLYRALSMQSTSSRYRDYQAAANRALPHVRQNGAYVARYQRDADTQSPAGGVSSTVRDLTQWMRLQLNRGSLEGRQIVDEAALRATWEPTTLATAAADSPTGQASFYGLGWGTAKNEMGLSLSHSGAFDLGIASNVRLAPDKQLGIVVLSNAAPVGMPEAITTSFMDLALKGAPTADWFSLYGNGITASSESLLRGPTDYSTPPKNPGPPRSPSAYSGVYASDYYGTVEIAAGNGQLSLIIGPMRQRYLMRHWDGDTFVYQPEGENAVALTGVMFTVDQDGVAKSLRIEYLDQHGEGGFSRLPGPTSS
jgi:CubicO group peptidase (beta-lactamase class C family)